MENCEKFWCVNVDCDTYSTGIYCSECDQNNICSSCMLYSELDDNRPYDCAIREDGILRGCWSSDM